MKTNLIIVEGLTGSRKSTIAEMTADKLQKKGRSGEVLNMEKELS